MRYSKPKKRESTYAGETSMNALPLVAAGSGSALIASMILLIALAFTVVVWVVADRYTKTHPSRKTGTEQNNQ
jgi:hypothetical protein